MPGESLKILNLVFIARIMPGNKIKRLRKSIDRIVNYFDVFTAVERTARRVPGVTHLSAHRHRCCLTIHRHYSEFKNIEYATVTVSFGRRLDSMTESRHYPSIKARLNQPKQGLIRAKHHFYIQRGRGRGKLFIHRESTELSRQPNFEEKS